MHTGAARTAAKSRATMVAAANMHPRPAHPMAAAIMPAATNGGAATMPTGSTAAQGMTAATVSTPAMHGGPSATMTAAVATATASTASGLGDREGRNRNG